MSKKSARAQMMERKGLAEEIAKIAQDYADYIDGFGNECAYTDDMLRVMKKRFEEMSID